MKKNDLIKKLQSIAGNPEICILDYKRNQMEDDGDGDGSGAGVYSKLGIERFKGDDMPDGTKSWIGLSFDNIYHPEEGPAAGQKTFDVICSEWMEWSIEKFEKATKISSIQKLKEELKELEKILNSDGDTEYPDHELPEEYVDVFMCLLHSAKKAGIDFDVFRASFIRKFGMNKRRKWKENANNTYSHI